jgi:hypothetical protein
LNIRIWVRRIILTGTGPRGGEGMTFTDLSIEDLTDRVNLLLHAFFTPTAASQQDTLIWHG